MVISVENLESIYVQITSTLRVGSEVVASAQRGGIFISIKVIVRDDYTCVSSTPPRIKYASERDRSLDL